MTDCAIGVLIDLSLEEPSLPVPDIIEDIPAGKLNGTFTVDELVDIKTQPDLLGSIDDKDLLKKHAEQEKDRRSSYVDILKEATEDEANQILAEKFDFDLSLSPGEKCKAGFNDDDDEVFFGPVGFSERCVAAIVRSQTPVKPAYKQVSRLNPQQQAELAKEALSVACRISNLRPSTSSESDTIDTVDSIQLSPLKSISDSFNLDSIVIKNSDAVTGINETFEIDNKHDTTHIVIKPSPAKKMKSLPKACPPKQISKSLKILFNDKSKENLTAKRRSICKLNQPGSQGGKVIGTLTKQNLQKLSVPETNNKPQSRIKTLSALQQPARTKLQAPASKLPNFGANLSYIKAVSSESLDSIASKRKRQDSDASDTTDPGSIKSYKTETMSTAQTSAHRRSLQLPQAKGRRLSRLQPPGTVSSSISMNNTFISQTIDTSMGIPKPTSRLKAPSDSNKKNCIKAPQSVSALPNPESKLRKSNSGSNLQITAMRAPSIKPQLIQPKGFQRKNLATIESKIKPVASQLPKGPIKAIIPSSNLNKTANISQPGMKGDACCQLEETPVKPEKKVQPKRLLDSTFSKANESSIISSTPNTSSRAMRSHTIMATPTKSDSDISLGPGLPAGLSSSTPVDKSKGSRRSMLPMLSNSEFGSVGSIPSPFSVRGSTSSRKSLSSIGSESSVFENTNELRSSSRNVSKKFNDHQIQLDSIDDMSPSSMLPKKTLVQYTPNIKETKMPSNWSPVKRQRPTSLEEQATQCTKRPNSQS